MTTISEFRCPHGYGPNDSRYAGTWYAPFSSCGCCGVSFPYIDSASWGTEGSSSRTWTPKNRCGACGGKYVESSYTRPNAAPVWKVEG